MKRISIFIKVTLSVLSINAAAGVVLQAESVTANQPLIDSYYSLDNMINQNSLTINYVSGETDFDTFIASNPTDDYWYYSVVSFENSIVDLDFYLGGLFTIESMALWNRGWPDQGIKEFKLYASDDSSFTNTTLLGQFTATAVLGSPEFTEVEVFSFEPISTSYIRMSVLSSYNSLYASLNEVAFEAVPEPGSMVLLIFGGMIAIKRRHKQ